ncbi:MAG: O-antigen ligase family protein [bacterium]
MNNRKYYDYGVIITLLFLILSLPLYFNPNLENPFDLGKATVMRVLSLIMISIWLMKVLLIGHRFIRTPLDLPITAYLLVSTLATIFSVSPLLSFIGFYRRYEGLSTLMIYIILFYVTVNFINNRKLLKLTINTAILAGVLTSIYGILQYYKVDPFRFELFEGFRVHSTTGNPAYLAAYLIMVLPLALSMYLLEEKKDSHPSKKKRDKRTREKEFLPYLSMLRPWWYLISFVLIYICLFFTFTRGCILGFIGSMLLFGILSWRAKIIKNKRRLWIFLGILIPMTAWLCVGPGKVVIQRFTSERVKEVKTQPEEKLQLKKEVQPKEKPLFKKIPEEELVLPSEPKEDTTKIEFAGSAGSRIRTWKIVLKMIADYPLLGVGPESMALVYPLYASFGFDRAHNDILDTAVTRGIIGLITYLWLLVSFAIFAYRCYKKS